jgi:demethylmenaquinone methyltransferase/2-methoxy-6-polyprenyl-1,4-benzoquinol methylase
VAAAAIRSSSSLSTHPRIDSLVLSEISARELFAPLGPTYDRYARLLSLGQDPRWRRFMVSRVPPGAHVLDVATGTGAVAAELVRRGCTVVGLDQSPEMLAVARRRLPGVELVEGRAEALPFPDGAFEALTFTYLLRYVADPVAVLAELARVVAPGGTIASLEFAVPRGLWRPLWELYVRVGLPAAGALVSPGWREVGRFLGPSIRAFHARHDLVALWREAGIRDVRARRMSLGGGIVVWGRAA